MNTALHMENNILELYAGLCREAARCDLHSLRAVKDGRPELAPLFKSLSLSLTMQAKRFMVQIRGTVTSTEDAVEEVYGKILPASINAYEILTQTAGRFDSRALANGFEQSARVQQKNSSLYQQVARDRRTSSYYVCDFCGYVARNAAPDHCPICTAPEKRFLRVSK